MSLKSIEHNSLHLFESDDHGFRHSKSPSQIGEKDQTQLLTPEQIQLDLRQQIQLKKERNEANQQLQKFKKCLQKQDNGNSLTTLSEKMSMIPNGIGDDLQEAVLYAYFAVRYYDEHIFKVIVTRCNNFKNDPQNKGFYQRLGGGTFAQLTNEYSYSRYWLNQTAFEIAIKKDYFDVAFHFIETGQVHITWEMVKTMLNKRQEYLVKQCIKYGSKFDAGSASLKKIVFAGRSAAPLEDRTIKLVDFIQVMLDLKWPSKKIQEVLVNYSKKSKIDSIDIRELFLMFAVKRKIKLMSFLINGEQFLMEFTQDNFIDVIENDAYDMGVLLYREYFLQIDSQFDKILNLLVNSFTKTNGLLEAKSYLIKKFYNKMNFDQAIKLLIAIEERIDDSSKGNILILTLNVIKACCLLIELAEKVRLQFNFLNRRCQEIRAKLVRIANKFMDDIQTEEEMRFYMLEKDLDERDALNIIYDYSVIELLENPFTQNIIQQIWSSQYNNSHFIFATSSLHRLLFNYNHCRYDEEEQLRFYKKRDLTKIGCHPFQFQVWRYSGESRHLISSITTLVFIIIMHYLFITQMSRSIDLQAQDPNIQYWKKLYYEKDNQLLNLSAEQIALRTAVYKQWNLRIYDFQLDCMVICYVFHCSWMYLLQYIFNVVFSFKNKRTPHLADIGNLIDIVMFMVSLLYIFSAYKGWRLNTFLEPLTDDQLGERYWSNYMSSPINENAVLIVYGALMWMRVFYNLKLIRISGSLFAIIEKMFIQMLTFAIYYFSLLFLYAVVGFVLFYDIEEFSQLNTAMFTLFKATIQDYDADIMKDARIGAFLGYAYFISYMILNLILLVNLIVARLANTYKEFNHQRHLLMLLNTLFVREISEADEKYSAIVSAPFPLNMLQLSLGSLVISLKSPSANIALLNLYYLPISSFCFIVFVFYQILILPFCYFKIIGHKFALMVKSPQGLKARTTLDRAGHGILFIIIGPIILVLNSIVDWYWFLKHMYKMDLDKSHLQVQETVDIHRRTYKKMIKYFEEKNEQLVPQKRVAEDLRHYLDVIEGVKCMIYGRPKEISKEKLGLYEAYAKQFLMTPADQKGRHYLSKEALDNENVDIVEQVVQEFNVVKQVLLNNSFPVDMRMIQKNSVKKKGWGMKILFDKKTFYSLLIDLERMRKVLNLKKRFYLFHIPYEGKPQQMSQWHIKVEKRITQTLKFLNTARLLKIIGYDPTYHIKPENINLAMGSEVVKKNQLDQDLLMKSSSFKRLSSLERTQSDQKMDNLEDQDDENLLVKKSINSARQNINQINQSQDLRKKPIQNTNEISKFSKEYFNRTASPAIYSPEKEMESIVKKKPHTQLDMSFHEPSVQYDSQQKQLNYYSPSKYGVINQQPQIDIQGKRRQDRQEEVIDSERSEADVESEDVQDEGHNKKFAPDNFGGGMKSKK